MRTTFLFIVFAVLFLAGCTGVSGYYVLSTPSHSGVHYTGVKQSIGVEEVTVPKYLFKREIAVAKSPHRIAFMPDAQWAEDLDTGLTRRLVSYLQHAFANPDVHAYPWGVERQPQLKVKVDITRFIAQNNVVYLDAGWIVEDLRTGKQKAGLFSTSVPAKEEDAESIVAAMDTAFQQLEASIARGMKEKL